MATAPSLFGGSMSPQEMQSQLLNQRATAFTQQTPDQQLGNLAYKAGSSVGTGLAGAFGVDIQDPMIKRATQIRQMASQFDTNTPEGMAQYAEALRAVDPEMGLQAAQKAIEMRGIAAETKKKELTVSQEAALRGELAALGPNATQAEIMAAVTKYGSADKILALLQTSADKGVQNQMRLDKAKEDGETKIEAARMAAEARVEAARVAGENREAIARIQNEGKETVARLIASLNKDKPLTAAQQLKQSKATAKSTFDLRAQDDDFNSLIKEANNIVGSKGFETVQGISGAFPSLPGSNASKTDALITGFKSRVKKIGLDQARIGGSIGAMTEKEWPIVEQMVANISPLAGNVKEQMAAVIAKMEAMQVNSRTLHADTYGEETLPKMKTRAPSIPTGAPPAAAGWGKATVVK
jgi:hypothetical protein